MAGQNRREVKQDGKTGRRSRRNCKTLSNVRRATRHDSQANRLGRPDRLYM